MFKTVQVVFILFLIEQLIANETPSADETTVPGLFFAKTNKLDNQLEYNIGEPINEQVLVKDILEKLYTKSTGKVAIVLFNKIDDQNIRFNIPKYVKDNRIVYVPSISNGYDTISDYLNGINVHIERYQIDDNDENKYKDAFKMFNLLMSKYDSVIMTGLRSSIRNRRQKSEFNEANSNNNTLIFGDQCVAFFKSIYAFNQTVSASFANRIPLIITKSSFDCTNNLTSTLELEFSDGKEGEFIQKVQIKYKRQSRVWSLMANETLAVSNKGKTYAFKFLSLPSNSETPIKYSFGCTMTKFQLTNTNSTTPSSSASATSAVDANKPLHYFIYIEELQIQPFDVSFNNSVYQFGTVNYCNGFFTNGIWMGIASSLLLGVILALGIYAVSSITTMDRFDDAKGKPLVINAEK